MASWDFTIDSEIERELADKLDQNANEYDQKVSDMYSKISSMSEHWVGEDYDMFKDGTERYQPALKDLSNGIRMYATHFNSMADGTDELATELIDIVTNMTKTK